MWNELETLVKTHAGGTDRHQRVLDCIVACRSKPTEDEDRKKRGRKREDREDRTDKSSNKDTEDKSWQESERFGLILSRLLDPRRGDSFTVGAKLWCLLSAL